MITLERLEARSMSVVRVLNLLRYLPTILVEKFSQQLPYFPVNALEKVLCLCRRNRRWLFELPRDSLGHV